MTIYVAEELSGIQVATKRFQSMDKLNVETLRIEILLPGFSLMVGFVYRWATEKENTRLLHTFDAASALCLTIILGEFNYPGID